MNLLKQQVLQARKILVVISFMILLIFLTVCNFMTYQNYQTAQEITVITLDGILFLIIGIVLLGISCFTFLQLNQYKIGRYFAVYVLLLGMTIALAPCGRLNENVIPILRNILTLSSSVLLFRIVGLLTLQTEKRLYFILQVILAGVAVMGIGAKICTLFPLKHVMIYMFMDECENDIILVSAILCIVLMSVNYLKSNTYARKQMRSLFVGIGVGTILFMMFSMFPNFFFVSGDKLEEETIVEIYMKPTDTATYYIPLLLFASVSIAIVFVILHRDFSLDDMRLGVKGFILTPIWFGIINILIFAYMSPKMCTVVIIDILLLLMPFICFFKYYYSFSAMEEKTYEWKMLEEIEKEKQELSIYLHDDVLQLLIAFYRKVQSDKSGRYTEIGQALPELISKIRSVSHNLYPTMVEDLGLEQSLQIYIEEAKTNYQNIDFGFQYKLKEGILPKSIAMTFYRISKELVNNALKHAGGTKVNLIFEEDNEAYYIRIEDNGKGMDMPGNMELIKSSHMGIYTVKKQVADLNGRMDVISKHGMGTKFQICFPKKG